MYMIRKKDAVLHIDVVCYDCGKLWARSYCNMTVEGRYQCQNCSPSLEEAIVALKTLTSK